MRRIVPIAVTALFVAGLPVLSQSTEDVPYEIRFNPDKDVTLLDRYDGKDALFIKVKFIVEVKGNPRDHRNYKIHIYEDGKEVAQVDLPAPKPNKGLSVILAVDTSAKIEEHWEQVLKAVDVFFKELPKEAECGLILFNDNEERETFKLSRDRGPIIEAIRNVKPEGGNACLKATLRAIKMLEPVPADKAKAVVLISNGLDRYSPPDTRGKIIAEARKNHVVVHTIGIGEATRPQNVNIVLVLDHSGSMELPADDASKTPKIQGLHKSATAFIERIPPSTRTTLIPFGSIVDVPRSFRTAEAGKKSLIADIQELKSEGETALFDAVFSALATLEADNATGKRIVLAMTDGIDNISRRRAEEVIERAKDAGVPLFMLGFGRDDKDRKELDAATMTKMADQTGGMYFHAANEAALLKYFEHLAIKLNEQGIDADTLRDIAARTSGTYNHARDVKNLPLILKEVNQALTNREEERIFKAGRQVRDAVSRKITLKLVKTLTKVSVANASSLQLVAGKSIIELNGEQMLVTAVDSAKNLLTVERGYSAGPNQSVIRLGSDGKLSTTSQEVGQQSGTVAIKGVVVAQMDHLVYLALLGFLGILILLPAFFRRA